VNGVIQVCRFALDPTPEQDAVRGRTASAVERFANPDEYASSEFFAHHGAVVFLARFQVFRRS
jgi:hypothetical protein